MGKWIYGDYKISLYHSNSSFHTKVKNIEGNEIPSILFFGVFGTCPHSDFNWISSSAHNVLKDTIAVFPYLKNDLIEIWAFEAISSTAPSIYKARKTLKKEPSEEGFKKALRYLGIALKIQKYHKGKTGDLEKVILTTKKEFFLFQIEGYTKYLSSEEEINLFSTIIKNGTHNENIFEEFLELIKPWEGEDADSYIRLLRAVSYEFLDQPLLAAESYAHLAEKVSSPLECARSCIEKALSFFDRKDISYANFLEQLNRETLDKLDLEELLFEKDAIRMSFEKALITLAKQSKQTNIPSCFICSNPQESDVLTWVHRVLVSDLKKMGIRPISLEDLSSVEDYNNFQKNISEADKVIIVCTPDLKKKCKQQPLIGVAQEIRFAEQRYENGMGETISLIYFKGDRSVSCPSHFFEPIFANHYSKLDQPKEKNVFNYYDIIFELVAPIKGISSEIALEIKELFLKEVQKVINREIAQNEVKEWRKIDKKIALSTIKDLKEMYGKIESILPIEQKIEIDLRKYYTSKKYLTLLVSQKPMPIETLYTRLAIFGEVGEKAKEEVLEKEKPGQSLEDRRPLTHESIFKSKQAIELEALFDHDLLRGKDKRILIQGSAGIGKSTLCHYIAYRWAKKELFKEFDYLFWLPLRRLSKNIYSKTNTFEEYVAKECGLQNPQAFFKKTELREKTLILLDGYDELSPDTNADECFHPILTELKNFPHVIVTSRPQTVNFTKNCELEILGFDAQRVKEYIDRFFREEQQVQEKKLQTYLNNPLIGSLAHIPINLEIFCSLAITDNSLFTSLEFPTMTMIYTHLTEWLFKRFRIERGEKKGSESTILISNPNRAPDVRLKAQALEKIAWKAMEKDTLYLDINTIETILESINEEIDIGHITNIGPFKIESEQGVFIHLTFQEYFAAVYLAHSYEKKQKKAKKLLEKIKFEPRYKLMLSMTAGFLSQKAKPKVLSAFFEDLFSEPRDLAKSYELCLFAQCFEECLRPEKILHYQQFVEIAAEYIKAAPVQSMNFQLLNCNRKLLHHPLIVETILEKMEQKTNQKEVIDLLGDLAREKKSLPSSLIVMLSELVFKEDIKENIIEVLCRIGESGQIGAEESLRALLKVIWDSSLDEDIQTSAVSALERIVRSGQLEAEEAQKALQKAVFDPFLDEGIRTGAVGALGRIAWGAQEAQIVLIKAMFDPFLNKHVKTSALNALEMIAKLKRLGSKEAENALVKAASNSSLDKGIQRRALDALGRLAQSKQLGSKEVENALVEAASDSSLDKGIQRRALDILTRVAQSGHLVLQETQITLVKMALDFTFDLYVRNKAMDVLGWIAGSGQFVFQETQSALAKAVFEHSLHEYIRKSALDVLGTIVVSGQAGAEEAASVLVKAVFDLSVGEDIQSSALDALSKSIEIESRQTLSLQAESPCVKKVSDSTLYSDPLSNVLDALTWISKSEISKDFQEAQSLLESLLFAYSLHEGVQKDAVDSLENFKWSDYLFHQRAQSILEKVLFDPSVVQFFIRIKVIDALGDIAKSGQRGAQEAQSALIKVALDSPDDERIQISAICSLERIGESGQLPSYEVQNALIKMSLDSSLDGYVRVISLRVLGRIARSEERFIRLHYLFHQRAQSTLEKVLFDPSVDQFTRIQVIHDLGDIAKSGQRGAQEAQSALIKVVLDSPDNEWIRRSAICSLESIGESGQLLSYEVQNALIEMSLDSVLDEYVRMISLGVLGRIARSEQMGSQNAQNVLINIVFNSSYESDLRIQIIKDLKEIKLSKLAKTITNKDSYLLVQKICYVSQRALVISGNEICISDRRYRESFPMQNIDIDHLRSIQFQEIYIKQSTFELI